MSKEERLAARYSRLQSKAEELALKQEKANRNMSASIERKLARIEKKQARIKAKQEKKALKKKRKQQKKLTKQFKSTVKWIEVDYVADNFVSIHNEEYVLFGLKIIPPEIALESKRVIASWLSHLVLVLNSTTLTLINDTVLSPINVDVDIMKYQERMNKTDDPVMKRLYLNQIELLEETSMNMRSEYFVMCQCKRDDKKTLQKFDELYRRFQAERFNVEQLNRRDFINYIAYHFRNQYIYDYYCPRAIFEILDENTCYINEEGEIVNDADR